MNTVERIKKEKDGLAAWDDLARFAAEGFASIGEDDFTRLRWYGIYQQRPNNGHFMLRVKIPGGQFTAEQARVIADIADERGRSLCDLTTRQDVQFHWLTIEDMPGVIARLQAAGLTTTEACGDVTRNITGCPLHGVNADEVTDGSALIRRLADRFLDDPAFSDLPRKYKICVSGCGGHCAKPEINDLAFLAIRRPSDDRVGYNVLVGGGLSTQPRFAQDVNIWVTEDQAVDVAVAVTEIFRDDGYRMSRHRARLKYLMEDWGPDEFRARIQAKLPFSLEPAVPYVWSDDYEDHAGVRPQKQQGLFSLGAVVTVGRLAGAQLRAAADVAALFGQGRLCATLTQNLVVLDVPADDVAEASLALSKAGLLVDAGAVRRAAVTCTGIEFCNLAVAETKERMREVVDYVEQHAPMDRPFRMHMNGCPNSCGQHHIADIGFQAGRVKIEGVVHECFDVTIGGGLGAGHSFTHPVRRKVLSDDVKGCVANLLNAYTDSRRTGEPLRAFLRRHTDVELNAFLGTATVPEGAEVVD